MQDLRDAVRALKASPAVSAVAILSLALGIGANTAIFSILDSLLLKQLPVREPHRLIALGSDQAGEYAHTTYPIWQQIRDRHLLTDSFVWASDRLGTSDTTGETVSLQAIWASGDFFERLGVPAIAGRTFTAADDRRGGGPDGPVAVISHGLWQRRFGSSPDVIGRTLSIDRVPFVIVGVTPASFFGLSVGSAVDVILPLETEPLLKRFPPRLERWSWLYVMARLAPGETVASATAAMRGAQTQIREATLPAFIRPAMRPEDRDAYLRKPWTMTPAATGTSELRGRYRPALATLLVIVGLVLVVACANIANLQLARTEARRYEFTVRVALGASRWRVARQLLVENLLLSLVGAALGLLLAQWGSRVLVAQLSTWFSAAFLDLAPDWRVLGLTAAVSGATAILFGTAPALRAARVDPLHALRQQSGGFTSARRFGLATGLVVAQIALSLVLVVAAGLFLQSFKALAYRDLGFDRSRVLIAVVDARRSSIPPPDRMPLYERVREAAAGVAGVESAAISLATPLGNAGIRQTPEILIPGHADFAQRASRILTNAVSPGWFRTFGTRLVAGRDFESRDDAGAANVAIVNEAFVRRYLDGATPLGRTLMVRTAATTTRPLEIIGVVEDAAFISVRDAVDPTIYRPLGQAVDEKLLTALSSISVSVRAAQGSPLRLTTSLASAISGVDTDLAVSFVAVNEQLNAHYVRERLLALLSGFFGALALLLAGLGLYGVTAHAASERRTEIGIRMALGADARHVVRLVLGRVIWVAAAGVTLGALVSWWGARFIRTLLFGLQAHDRGTFVAAALVLLFVAAAAGWFPARRAARADPAVVLRNG